MKPLIPCVAIALLAGCVSNTVRLPNQPGGPNSDLSSKEFREQWVADHPNLEPAMRDAILQGVFIETMPLEVVNVITNPDRRGTTGNGYWRRFTTGDEVRLRWFLAGERLPFLDGLGRNVCELVLVRERVSGIIFCEPPGPDAPAPAGSVSKAESETSGGS